MRNLIVGIMLGSVLTASLGLARDLYDSKGNYQAQRGSQQSYDYFRQRQQQLDTAATRRAIEQGQSIRPYDPCGR
jgi:hypothetical protein